MDEDLPAKKPNNVSLLNSTYQVLFGDKPERKPKYEVADADACKSLARLSSSGMTHRCPHSWSLLRFPQHRTFALDSSPLRHPFDLL